MNYKLLTPGPLTTTDTVKQEMLFDYSTWDNDYKEITQSIRRDLLELAHVNDTQYTTVLMQGSGTFGVESVLSSTIGKEDKVLVSDNGAYGRRMVQICQANNINHEVYQLADNELVDPQEIKAYLENDPTITHVAVIHNETTTGLVNDIEAIGKIVKEANRTFIVDAMSSFGGLEIFVEDWGIDFLVSSANKCIQGVPGFSFIIGKIDLIKASKGIANSVSLDLYDQWETMDVDGKWRFTSPTHTVVAFRQALNELAEEGGIAARAKRYKNNNDLLNERMSKLGFESYLEPSKQGPFISTFLVPEDKAFDFQELYNFIKERGYVIYPGKLTDRDSFRIGNIGEIYPQDIINVTNIIGEYMDMKNNSEKKLVIFDWAGTTVDFGCMAPVEAFRKAFSSKDIEVTDEEIREPMGMSKIDHVRTMLNMDRISQSFKEKHGREHTEEDVQEIYHVSEVELLNTVGEHSEPKPAVVETVNQLKANGVFIGSTTGYTKEMMDIVVPNAEKQGYTADFLATADDTDGKGRPYPYMVFKNVEHFDIADLDQVVKVGDTVADIREGKNANITSIGVIDGSSEMGLAKSEFDNLTEEEKDKLRNEVAKSFLEAGADYVIHDFTELPTILNA